MRWPPAAVERFVATTAASRPSNSTRLGRQGLRVTTRIGRDGRDRLWMSAIALVGFSSSLATGQAPIRARIADLAARPVVIEVTVGEVHVQAWDRAGVEAEIESGGPGTSATALEASVEERPEAVTVRAVQREGGKDAALRARVRVKVPAHAIVRDVEVFEGALVLEGLRGEVRASIERGTAIGRRLSGIVRIETGSGDLSVTDAELSPAGLLRLRAFNGNVTLGLTGRPRDARILALTLSGRIYTDLPLSERAGFGPRFREGIFGKGEPLISIDVVRGDITINAPKF
jgi:hypothetical protein